MDRKDWMNEAFGPSHRKTPSMMPFVVIVILIAGAGLQGLLDIYRKTTIKPVAAPESQTTSSNRQSTIKRDTHKVDKVGEMSVTREQRKPVRTTNSTSNQPAHLLHGRDNALSTAERVFYENYLVDPPLPGNSVLLSRQPQQPGTKKRLLLRKKYAPKKNFNAK
ncbi:MAG: hypothetical protein LIQ31_01740 [Planctomycetes bacterium]|nr:hypothetical protein [Planctomycetota bacterium]